MSTTIHVSGLAPETTSTTLEEFFAKQGQVESVELMQNDKNAVSTTALVVLVHAEDAQRALVNLNGKDLDGRKLRMRQAMQRRSESN